MATVERTSVSLYPKQMARLKKRASSGHVSTQIQADLELLWMALDRGLASLKMELLQKEIMFLLDVLEDFPLDTQGVGVLLRGGLALSVSEAITLDALDKAWGIDGNEIQFKVRKLANIEILALADFARRYLGADENTRSELLDQFRKE